MIGTTLAHYRISAAIGAGGMGDGKGQSQGEVDPSHAILMTGWAGQVARQLR